MLPKNAVNDLLNDKAIHSIAYASTFFMGPVSVVAIDTINTICQA
jgi:hypothetical protein